jgi:hypothetical protein
MTHDPDCRSQIFLRKLRGDCGFEVNKYGRREKAFFPACRITITVAVVLP